MFAPNCTTVSYLCPCTSSSSCWRPCYHGREIEPFQRKSSKRWKQPRRSSWSVESSAIIAHFGRYRLLLFGGRKMREKLLRSCTSINKSSGSTDTTRESGTNLGFPAFLNGRGLLRTDTKVHSLYSCQTRKPLMLFPTTNPMNLWRFPHFCVLARGWRAELRVANPSRWGRVTLAVAGWRCTNCKV